VVFETRKKHIFQTEVTEITKQKSRIMDLKLRNPSTSLFHFQDGKMGRTRRFVKISKSSATVPFKNVYD
jgi:hypothetical protein